jgi:hypothetical protein
MKTLRELKEDAERHLKMAEEILAIADLKGVSPKH